MSHSRSLLILALSSLLSLVSAAATITSPSAGEKVSAGQPFEVTWTGDSGASVGLSICYGQGQGCTSIVSDADNSGSYQWTPDADLTPRTNYYLLITTADGKTNGSKPFAITGDSPSGSSSSSSSPVSSAGPSQTAISSPINDPTSPTDASPAGSNSTGSSTSAPSTDDSGSSSNGAIIGGAIGAVVVVILIAIIGFIWMRKRNKRKIEEAKRSALDDVESGEKKPNGGITTAAAKKSDHGNLDVKHPIGDSSNIPLAELPAIQQEAVEMAAPSAAGGSNHHFMVMELDSREIPRPGTSSVKPDVDPTSAKPSIDRTDAPRTGSIDGTTVNSETERPKTAGTIEQIKEESREGSSTDVSRPVEPRQQPSPQPRLLTPEPRSATPAGQDHTSTENSSSASPAARDSTPQIGSLPQVSGFDFDIAKF
ncbi:hypothetical protein TWF696_003295 [Orbilia brochopaga]|uniref:Yeast cell wall synthesis Kre9/Knh1-like N-terminal domain-containing protein n=1 Tax=Orbilia brochopaga TaxID=3140254 RepID=A0AAV9TY51_9PEZI